MKKTIQDLPKAEVAETPVDDGKTEFLTGHVYEVCSWRPGPPGSGPPTQVAILIKVVPGITSVLRLKSARALDELVGVLLEYRKEVWP